MGDNTRVLDNVVWSALTTQHASIAIGHGLARHYPRDMAPFSAVAEPTVQAYADLAQSSTPGLEVRLFRPREEPTPARWETLSVRPIIQMVAEWQGTESASAACSIEPLTVNDAADMTALAEITKPGPVAARTVLLGRYVGIRDPSTRRLIAMAGERFNVPGYVELSAVGVHPDMRGRGYGRTLTLHLVHQAFERGEVPFLHVFPDNPATALYARWGFRKRAVHYVIWRRPLPPLGRGEAS